MTPTPELRTRLRRLIDEKIPQTGSDADTRFSDADLDDLLNESQTVYGAAALGWTEKAGMLQDEMGEVEETRLGQESYRLVQLKERLAYALTMAKEYGEKDRAQTKTGGSYILSVTTPEVL